jgi:hypothetical protein
VSWPPAFRSPQDTIRKGCQFSKISGSPAYGRESVFSFQPEWEGQIEKWRELLASCTSKPSQKRVHALRTFTLRLPVVLEYCLHDQAQGASAVTAFTRWRKQGKKLRRKLQPIRDADVYLLKLKDAHKVFTGLDSEPKLRVRRMREMKKLESRLKQQRRKGEDKLMAFIGARGKHLRKLSQEMQDALAPYMPSRVDSTVQSALRIFVQVARDLPELNSTNLHTFRKRLKSALYLAKTSADADPLAKRLAMDFEKMSVAIGDWHDWETLSLEAKHIFPSYANQDDLVSLMKKLADDALEKALGICRRTAARLLKNAISET